MLFMQQSLYKLHCRTTSLIRTIALSVICTSVDACNSSPAAAPTAYTPHIRELTVTTVPLLVKEGKVLYPFLKTDFAKGGVLDGKEVYGFSPSTITVVEGDTIHFTFINPEDDVHSFVLPDFAVSLPAQQITRATYVAKHAGIYQFVCAIQAHLPMMSGQLVVLSPGAVASSNIRI
jgi:plastocyanin